MKPAQGGRGGPLTAAWLGTDIEDTTRLSYCVVAASFVAFQFLFSAVSPQLSSLLSQRYMELPPGKKCEWDSRCVSTAHALVVGSFCLYILAYDDAVNENPIWGDPRLVKLNVAITCGYLLYVVERKTVIGGGGPPSTPGSLGPQRMFQITLGSQDTGPCSSMAQLSFLARDKSWVIPPRGKSVRATVAQIHTAPDMLLLARYWKTMGDSFFVCHHLAVLYAYGYVLNRGVLPFFANFRLISELSTPFVNQRWFFDMVGQPRSSWPVLVNGFTMTVVFFLVRIAVIPWYYTETFSTFGTEAYDKLGAGPQVAWIVSSVVLDILNVVWMYKIIRGFYRVVSKERPKFKPKHAD